MNIGIANRNIAKINLNIFFSKNRSNGRKITIGKYLNVIAKPNIKEAKKILFLKKTKNL